MYEIDTQVRYHGSIDSLHGETFLVARLCCDGTRYVLSGPQTLHHVRPTSITLVPDSDPIDQLEAAIQDQRPVMITYVAGNGDWTTRVIEPHTITYSKWGDASVRAHDRLRSAVRAFRVDRIESLTLLPNAFGGALTDDARERAAIARIRAEIAGMDESSYHGDNAMRWTPNCPALL